MAIFARKEKDKDKEKKGDNLLEMVPNEKDVAEKDTKPKHTQVLKEDTGNAYDVLLKPLITEKTYKGVQKGKFVFKVAKGANKISVKKAVERVYDVHVKDVNIMNINGKKRNFGRIVGRTSDWRKAIVTLKPGETIPEAKL